MIDDWQEMQKRINNLNDLLEKENTPWDAIARLIEAVRDLQHRVNLLEDND